MAKEITRDDLDLYVRDFGSGMRFIKHPLVNEILIGELDEKIPENFKMAVLPKGYDAETFGDAYVVKINFKAYKLFLFVKHSNIGTVWMPVGVGTPHQVGPGNKQFANKRKLVEFVTRE